MISMGRTGKMSLIFALFLILSVWPSILLLGCADSNEANPNEITSTETDSAMSGETQETSIISEEKKDGDVDIVQHDDTSTKEEPPSDSIEPSPEESQESATGNDSQIFYIQIRFDPQASNEQILGLISSYGYTIHKEFYDGEDLREVIIELPSNVNMGQIIENLLSETYVENAFEVKISKPYN